MVTRLCLAWVIALVAFWLVATLCLWEWMLDDEQGDEQCHT